MQHSGHLDANNLMLSSNTDEQVGILMVPNARIVSADGGQRLLSEQHHTQLRIPVSMEVIRDDP